jgi:hypothetical protein
MSEVCYFMPVIPALGKLRQEDQEFQASLGHSETPFQTNKHKNPKQNKK